MFEKINTSNAPAPNGPYSHAIRFGNIVFTSGQLPTDPKSGKIVKSDIKEQTRQVFKNIKAVLEAAGTDLNNILKVTVYIVDKKNNFQKMNEVYAEYIHTEPARTTIDVSFIRKISLKALIEIDCIAYIGKDTEG